MQTIRVQPALQDALQLLQWQVFTVAQLTQTYQDKAHNKQTTQKAARQFVYRNILRLIDAGVVEKLPTKKGWPRYQVTDAYKESLSSNSLTSEKQNDASQIVESPQATVIGTLQKRLNQHKSDMLCAMGEAEEYSAICQEHPDLQTQVQALYNEARDRTAILLGKVKALESLLVKRTGPN